MPSIHVHLFREEDGTVPLLAWLDKLRPLKAVAKCRVLIELLKTAGQDLRRPHADILRDGIYELRARVGRVQYRLLYFFHGQGTAILSHGFIKRGTAVDPNEIDKAIKRKEKFREHPEAHTHEEN
jgi:phage-related protein